MRRFYGFESWIDKDSDKINGEKPKSERKSSEACKSHREAERRRRQRINNHLSTLRSLLPNTAKSDKASLLAEVVQHVKRLRKEADDVANRWNDEPSSSCSGEPGSVVSVEEAELWPFPGESDEATVGYCGGEEGEGKRMKVTVCCEDRPGLNRDLAQAIRSVRAKPVRAEIMTVGGRTKSVVVVEWGNDGGEEKEVEALERGLKAVMENRAFVDSGMGPLLLGRKRARESSKVECSLLLRNENFC
ncbi:transcription factor bHLH30-like [Vicia villosa]|uniref:transcription factor bHLH30-like n=1 Tax=Vicia villosa TaxID=3911 RepID=UPI00273C6867|nr:transcription factor bHLH30-like [Vicia villosa]